MDTRVQLASCLPTVVALIAIAEQHRASEDQDRAFREGFAIGYEDGYEIGYGRAHEEMAQAWHAVYEAVQRAARRKTHADLMTARGEYYDHEGIRRAA